MAKKKTMLNWKCHTPNLLKEILTNHNMGILATPLMIFRKILVEVAERAIDLDDDKLNLLMCRLTLYSCADPELDDYDPKVMRQLEKKLNLITGDKTNGKDKR